MAISNAKPLLMIFMISSLLPLDNVMSQSYSPRSQSWSWAPAPSPRRPPNPPYRNSEKASFGFSFFGQQLEYSAIVLQGEASIAGGALQLTKTDSLGSPFTNSVGQAQYMVPIHLWDKATGRLADFITGFTFSINPKGSTVNADGFAFFLAPVDSTIPPNSYGGYLGLFNPSTALNNTSQNQIVAIEFDTYHNEWDPISTVGEYNHVGINVNSIRSVLSAQFPELDDGKVSVSINYDGESKTLGVAVSSITYPNKSILIQHVVDLRAILPEWVKIGFSGATGQFVETHEIFDWSFDSEL